jgi:hypothetical protein
VVRVPAISTYQFHPSKGLLKEGRQYGLDGNVLDILLLKDRGIMIVSLDNIHSSGSTNTVSPFKALPKIAIFELKVNQTQSDQSEPFEWILYKARVDDDVPTTPGSFDDTASKLQQTLHAEAFCHEVEVEEVSKSKRPLYSSLGEFLYGLENLRKRSHVEGDGETVEEIARVDPEGRRG